MSTGCASAASKQRGAALITALFLLIVVAALGAFAIRINANQQQSSSLEIAQFRASAAATAGLEFWSNRVFNDNNVPCTATTLPLSGFAGFDGFTVQTSCVRIVSGSNVIYEITADASRGTYGSADFVRRQLTRRVSTLGAGTW